MINNSSTDCSILLKFVTDFDHVTADVLQMFTVKCHGYSVKTSSDRQIIALLQETGVAESNGDVRILIGSSKMAVCAYAQYQFGQKQPRTTSATSGGLKVAPHSQMSRFLVRLC